MKATRRFDMENRTDKIERARRLVQLGIIDEIPDDPRILDKILRDIEELEELEEQEPERWDGLS
jgi:hypothetical protein